jgi:MFS transporter, MHS family, shikimate and dehydroshikimate transport protein
MGRAGRHSASDGNNTVRRRVQVSAYLGALIEWYDFYLYGFAATTVFNVLFFPELDATVGVIAALATLAIGFVARPLGAVIFAHYGDRVGRKGVLVVTLLLMGGASTLIGASPR